MDRKEKKYFLNQAYDLLNPDSTFKTNQWSLLLFNGMCPNASSLDMPIFFMLCSDDNESGQARSTLWLIMRAVF